MERGVSLRRRYQAAKAMFRIENGHARTGVWEGGGRYLGQTPLERPVSNRHCGRVLWGAGSRFFFWLGNGYSTHHPGMCGVFRSA